MEAVMSQLTSNGSVSQVETLQRQFAQAPGLPFAELLDKAQLERVLREEGVPHRNCPFSHLVTLWVWMSQVVDPDHSMRQAVARLLAWRVAQGKAELSSDTGAYAKARQRLPENVLAQLTRRTGSELMQKALAQWSGWHGHDVKMIDGSTASMPDTPKNQKDYPQPNSQKPGVGFPILRFVVLFSLAVGTVLNTAFAQYQGKQTGEMALLRQLHDDLNEGDVLLADRYFCSYFEIALLQQRGVHVVTRLNQRRRADFRRGKRLGKYDHLVTWKKPPRPDWMDKETYQSMPASLTMRELRVHAPTNKVRSRVITVVTTLLNADTYPKADIAGLYLLRWHAELDLRSIKQTLQMDVLRGHTPAIVRKEIWVHLLVYNLIRLIMAQAAQEHGRDPRTLSFKGTVQTLNAFALPLLTCADENVPEVIRAMLRAIVRHRVGNRPGRLEPRKRKRRPKPYKHLMQPRDVARKLEVQKSSG
jgi:DDE family transposase